MLQRIAVLIGLFLTTACSGGQTLSASSAALAVPTAVASAVATATPTTVPTTGIAKSMTLAQNGATPIQGFPGTFTLTAAEYDVHGKLLTGTYPEPMFVTTNDTSDLTLTALPANGSPVGGVTIANSQTVVLVTYDGLALDTGTGFGASASGLTSIKTAFAPIKPAVPTQVATLVIGEAGAPPYYGTAGQFALSINAYDANGNPISGKFSTPVVLTTNDGTDLSLTTTQNSGGSASVTVPNGQTVVFVSYDGKVVPNGTSFGAFSGNAKDSLAFDPTSSSAPPPIISRFGLTRNGGNPIKGDLGVFPVFVTAYDQNGNVINGTLPQAVNVTLNEVCDLSLSLGGAGSVSPCILNGKVVTTNNVGAVIINNEDQVVFVNYDGINPVPLDTTISATTLANVCAEISFSGNHPKPCPSQAPTSSRSRRMLR